MVTDLSSQYSHLLEHGHIAEAESLLLSSPAAVGYQKAIHYLWRFRNFKAFEFLREELLRDFRSNRILSWQELELLYYLQEYVSVGNPEVDTRLMLEEIFETMCRSIATTPGSRGTIIDYGLIWHGIIEESNEHNLPGIRDPDIEEIYGNLSRLDAHLMEIARLNRYRKKKIVLTRDGENELGWSSSLDSLKCAEIYIGPYYFKDVSVKQRGNARLPVTFNSPFRDGIALLVEFFLDSDWQVMPLICWRGGLAPLSKGNGRISFSYHTQGKVDGRFHYKFGHFSDIMTIDPLGYAGFSKLADVTWAEISNATQSIPFEEIRSKVESYRLRYIEERFTWRIQPPPPAESLRRGRRTIFVPLQDPFDEVARLGYLSPRDMVSSVREAADPDDVIYIKRHPVDRSALTTELINELSQDGRVIVTESSIHDLFKICDIVVTINSGVGFEALLAGLNVILAGKSDYNIVATTAQTKSDLIKALNGDYPPIDEESRLKFLFYYFEVYSFDPSRPAAFREKISNLLNL